MTTEQVDKFLAFPAIQLQPSSHEPQIAPCQRTS
jgi:hypothetical protein